MFRKLAKGGATTGSSKLWKPAPPWFTRKQLVEEGFEAVLSRKPRAMPAIARIFDGEREAKLIALACSKPPKGRARWTLRLENKVVELARQHDRTNRDHLHAADSFPDQGLIERIIEAVAPC